MNATTCSSSGDVVDVDDGRTDGEGEGERSDAADLDDGSGVGDGERNDVPDLDDVNGLGDGERSDDTVMLDAADVCRLDWPDDLRG